MTTKATQPNAKGNQNKVETAIYMLIDRHTSDFVREDTVNLPASMQQRLDSARLYRLPNTSIRVVKKDGKLVNEQIRHIANCNYIELEKQNELKYTPHTDDSDQIFFEYGRLIVSNEGPTAPLFDYLENCIDNRDAPNRPTNVEPIFYRYYPELDAENRIREAKTIEKARELVHSLYEEGEKEMVYDTERIDFLAKLFNIKGDSHAVKVQGLLVVAEAMPKEMLNSIADKTNDMRAGIADAVTTGALRFDGNKVLTGLKETITLMTTNAKGGDDQMHELIFFFTQNDEHWRQLKLDTEYLRKQAYNNMQ